MSEAGATDHQELPVGAAFSPKAALEEFKKSTWTPVGVKGGERAHCTSHRYVSAAAI